MNWYDIEDVLCDGTKEQISNLKCPDCSGKILFSYCEEFKSLTIKCKQCGYVSRGYKCSRTPNCVMINNEE